MGVGIAYPRGVYTLAASDIVCVPDTKLGGWSDPNNRQERRDNRSNEGAIVAQQNLALAVVKKASQSIVLPFTMLWRGFGAFANSLQRIWVKSDSSFPRRPDSPWDLAKNRVNTMVCLRLRHKDVDESAGLDFLVATYHMPCQFWEPATMTIHTAICLQSLQQLAENRYPHILAGDFNFKPHSPQYALTTTGAFGPMVEDPSDPEVDGKASAPPGPLYPNDPFKFTLPRGPYKSAYREALGSEPRFTNYAMTGNQTKPFCDTLDYIFYRDGEKFKKRTARLQAKSALDLTETCDAITGRGLKSLPSDTEYSDHLLLAAELELAIEDS
jgi:endonuclease/exonuclease/phosphatase family metal-dependent hydrolase